MSRQSRGSYHRLVRERDLLTCVGLQVGRVVLPNPTGVLITLLYMLIFLTLVVVQWLDPTAHAPPYSPPYR